MEWRNSDDKGQLRQVNRDGLLEMRVKFIPDPFCLLSVIRLHSQSQSPSFHDWQDTHRHHPNYGIRHGHHEGMCTLELRGE